MLKKLDSRGNDFNVYQVDYDVNGNSRYVVHYLTIDYDKDETQSFFINQARQIEHALQMLHGKKYRAKSFGGGIVFQAYAGDPIGHVQAAIKRAEILNDTGEDLGLIASYAIVRGE